MKRLFATLAILGISVIPTAHAFAFDPNYILSNDDMTDGFALDRNQIQAYLDRGYLGSYRTEDHEGTVRSAADIVWRAAQNNGINPKFLLVLLQKEQSLIEDDSPTQKQLDWAAGYAVCDDCSMSDPAIQRWKGFGKQVNSASLQFIEGYMADIEQVGTTQGKYGPDVRVEIDDEIVVPENAATAAMYAYTPHIHGNQNFVAIWERWFGAEYPTGSLVQAVGQDGVYLIEYGYKRAITSKSALVSRFNPDLIIPVNATTLDNYPTGTPISFPNYSLLKDEDGGIYLLVDDALRHIDSMEAFRGIGFIMDEVIDITNEERIAYTVGDAITTATVDPQGKLLKLKGTNNVFVVQDGVRHAILDSEIQAAHFPSSTPTPVEAVVIEQYREGAPLLLPDGYLVKAASQPTVYVVSEGMLRAIADEATFNGFGWEWSDIVTVKDDVIVLHPVGAEISSE